MFEPRLTPFEKLLRELLWAVSPQRCRVMTLGERARRAAGWLVLGALLAANAIAWHAHAYPAEVLATDARLEDQSARHLVYSLGLKHRGVEVRCLLVVYRQEQDFTVSC